MRLVSIFLLLLIFSCSFNKEPEYQHMEDLQVVKFNPSEIVLSSDLVFYNPNSVGATIDADNLGIWYKGNKIAKVETQDFKAKAKGVFKVPIEVHIPTKEFFKKNSLGVAKGLLKSLTNEKETFDLTVKGDLTLKVAGIKFKRQLNETQKIEF